MSQSLNSDNLAEAIIGGLKTYTEQVQKKVSKAVEECTKIAFEDIVEDSPVREKKVPKSGVIMVRRGGTKVPAADNLQPGAYKGGWITVVRKYEGRTQGYVRNKTNYQLVHLLELGHKARDGSDVNPVPHVNENEAKAREVLNRKINEILEKEN